MFPPGLFSPALFTPALYVGTGITEYTPPSESGQGCYWAPEYWATRYRCPFYWPGIIPQSAIPLANPDYTRVTSRSRTASAPSLDPDYTRIKSR